MTSGRHAFVSGRVQGVAYRWATRERAAALGVAGWVRNLADGRVEVWMEGAPADVEALLAWLRTGPSAARVAGVEVQAVTPRGLADFSVARTGFG